MPDRPVLDQVNLVVRDMGASTDFYRRLGLEARDIPPPWDLHHRELGTDEPLRLELDSATFATRWNEGWPAAATGAVIGFRVEARETVDAIYADLTGAGHAGQQPPYDAFWGARYAVVEDPDGNAVGIMSAADPMFRSEPPDPERPR